MGSRKASVLVGMSGGVDSAVAAALLSEEGFEVVGITMRLWTDRSGDPTAGGCCSLAGVEVARRTCAELGIEHVVVDLHDEFERHVVQPFVDSYLSGTTPNPCVLCNRFVRFDRLLRLASQMGLSRVATGHYVRSDYDPGSGRYALRVARCIEKDQTYMLYRLTQDQLAAAIFPLGEMPSKATVRDWARSRGLSVAARRESQDVCFVTAGGYGEFVDRRSGGRMRAGSFIAEDGGIAGAHGGIANFTIGQRKGLPSSASGPKYVTGIEPASGAIRIGPEADLWSYRLMAVEPVWVSIDEPVGPIALRGRIRYNGVMSRAVVTPVSGGLRAVFDIPQRAVTPGQSAVFYDDDRVCCGGIIATATEGAPR